MYKLNKGSLHKHAWEGYSQCNVTFVIFVLFLAPTATGAFKESQSLFVHPSGSSLSRALIFWGLGTLTSYFVGQSEGLILKYIVLFYSKACPRRSRSCICCLFVMLLFRQSAAECRVFLFVLYVLFYKIRHDPHSSIIPVQKQTIFLWGNYLLDCYFEFLAFQNPCL